jgi:hypothetical protein
MLAWHAGERHARHRPAARGWHHHDGYDGFHADKPKDNVSIDHPLLHMRYAKDET